MLSATYLQQLDDAELVRIASHEISDLTSTPLEVVLLARLETAIESVAEAEEFEAFADLADEFSVTSATMRALLESHPATVEEMAKLLVLLNNHDIHTKDQLEKLIASANEFRALASDAGDVFERLSTFATNAIKE